MSQPPITAPDTPIARQARELLHEVCEPHVIAHCERSFQFAALVGAAEAAVVDMEVLYVGTVLHDVGLAARFDGQARFEMRGANAVRAILLGAGMERSRAETAWDIIALHASTAIAAHKSIETRVANRGISIDVRGVGHDNLAVDAVRAVLDAWPRVQFPSEFARTLIDEVSAHPTAVALSWQESIAAVHVPGYQRAAFLQVLHASGDFV